MFVRLDENQLEHSQCEAMASAAPWINLLIFFSVELFCWDLEPQGFQLQAEGGAEGTK